MDDAARLVTELHEKLAELNDKVAAYQRDMLNEFERHMEDCLKDVPDDVSNEVSRVIAETMHKYPALNPSGRAGYGSADSNPQSPTTGSPQFLPMTGVDRRRVLWDGRKSPPPILYHTSGIPTHHHNHSHHQRGRSPHEREKEFRGVFTPHYLPLLENGDRDRDRNLHSPPISPLPAPLATSLTLLIPSLDEIKEKEAEKAKVKDAEVEVEAIVQNGDGTADEKPRPPLPVRRLTDRSTSSLESVDSREIRVPRSALRRTSSSTKGSPRRVRFVDLQGAEVSTRSASPNKAASKAASRSSSQSSTTTILVTSASDTDLDKAAQRQGAGKAESLAADESQLDDGYTGPSLLDVEGEEDWQPRPKKVSSTQALRELSRKPLDDGIWTTVNPEDPDETAVPKLNGDSSADTSAAATPTGSRSTVTITDHMEKHTLNTKQIAPTDVPPLGSPIEELEQLEEAIMNDDSDDDSDSDSDDGFLSMSFSRKSPSPAPRSPALQSRSSLLTGAISNQTTTEDNETEARPTPFTLPNHQKDVDDDDDMPFEIDETRDDRKPGKYLKEEEKDDEEEVDITAKLNKRLSTSLANEQTPPHDHGTNGNGVSAAALFERHSVGSYKGTTMRINPINNPKLYEEIARMKDVHFFVGGVDGRSGVEAADLGSYRANLIGAKGESLNNMMGATPRSFTERLALEEAMERRKMEQAD
ncbi:hypothetical protein QBC46DRAFT_385629 [Diplogelasinospora grovesii]|uniref:Uncharacterized protein n=1 Tax=Diplogelasinospora grovesii TaxID=303347 RepID=A0AAN6N8H2_9PEZI|nr:hypothetical protein QBC46DRAFT_385629 [Diplogelasinospora grovesii]